MDSGRAVLKVNYIGIPHCFALLLICHFLSEHQMARIWEESFWQREESSKARRLHVLMKKQNKISVAGKEKEGKKEGFR